MDLPNFIKSMLGWQASVDQKLDALATANAELATAQAEVSRLGTELAGAQATNAKLAADLTAAQAANEKLSTDLAATKADLKTAQDTIANPEGEISKRAALQANEIASKQGVPPVKEEVPAAKPLQTEPKPQARGFDAVVAAFRNQINTK